MQIDIYWINSYLDVSVIEISYVCRYSYYTGTGELLGKQIDQQDLMISPAPELLKMLSNELALSPHS